MSETETTSSVTITIDKHLKNRLDLLLRDYGLSLTDVLHRYIEKLVHSSTSSYPATQEVVTFLTSSDYSAIIHKAGNEKELSYVARQLLINWCTRSSRKFIDYGGSASYPDMDKLLDSAQEALDNMLAIYGTLPPFDGDLFELFSDALAALPLRATIDNTLREGIKKKTARKK